MRSIKTITTESHDGWSADAIDAEHEYQVARAEAQGRIAEMRGCAEDLAAMLESHDEDFAAMGDMEDYQSAFERFAEDLNRTR